MDLLQNKFCNDIKLISRTVTILRKDAYIQIFPNSNPVKIIANDPDEETGS